MGLSKSQLQQLRKMIKRRDKPRRSFHPKKVNGKDRPQYFRNPLSSPEPEPTSEQVIAMIKRFGCSRQDAYKRVRMAMRQA